jgi:hypothetical protein
MNTVSIHDRAKRVPGQPVIYLKHWALVDLLYVGKHEPGDSGYQGSPGRAIRKRVLAAHAAIGVHARYEDLPADMTILWTGDRVACRRLENAYIHAFRIAYPDRLTNLDRAQRGNHMKWVHDRRTHIDTTTNFGHGVFRKQQSGPDTDGRCGRKNCRRLWGDTPTDLWSELVHPDGRVERLWQPGWAGSLYDNCIIRKDQILDVD